MVHLDETPAAEEMSKQVEEAAGDDDARNAEAGADSEVQAIVDTLEEDGYVIVPGVLQREVVEAAKKRLLHERAEADASAFAKILTRDRRDCMRLPISTDNAELLASVVGSSKLSDVYKRLVGQDAKLVEFGLITSCPGAPMQDIHADVNFDSDARQIFTSFVALQDVTEQMGPTQVWSGTHTAYFCEFYKPRMLGPHDPYYVSTEPEKAIMSAGDVLIMDTRIMHCAGENKTPEAEGSPLRMLMHFSFETAGESHGPCGFTYNLVEEWKDRSTLEDWLSPGRIEAQIH
eukprot:TRINITY_DN62998_c0_g1_i1.p1 TRINITY_DN62998_c0_g1~~TRINITY_DN62998_c0_g1_i1.p1  ORF type:complete len:303 (+),score=48.49 TRINITY_DN62998_c0_g1_i1:44-910(+)